MYDTTTRKKLEHTVLKVYDSIDKQTPISWTNYSEPSLWYELVACILGSNVPFEHAQAATAYLRASGLLNVRECSKNALQYESRIIEALSKPICPSIRAPHSLSKYRYPRLRASHIRRTAESIYQEHGPIKQILRSSINSDDARIRVLNASVGIGPKQSSLFLRNIGYADNLAILDTHVLGYMFLLGMLPIKNYIVSTIARYKEVEERLLSYTNALQANLAYLDTAIWITMRVFRREMTT